MSFSQQLFAVLPGSKKAREAEQSVHHVYRYKNDLYTGGAFVKVGVCLYRESGPGDRYEMVQGMPVRKNERGQPSKTVPASTAPRQGESIQQHSTLGHLRNFNQVNQKR